MSQKTVFLFIVGAVLIVCSVEAQLGMAGDELSSSLHDILAQARKMEDEDDYEERGYTSASNRRGYRPESNTPDLTNVLGVDKHQLYRDFMLLQQEMASSDQEEGPSPYSSYDSDY